MAGSAVGADGKAEDGKAPGKGRETVGKRREGVCGFGAGSERWSKQASHRGIERRW